MQIPVQKMRGMTEVRFVYTYSYYIHIHIHKSQYLPLPPPIEPNAQTPTQSTPNHHKQQGLLLWTKSNALARGYTFSQRAGSLRPATVLVAPFSTDVEGKGRGVWGLGCG